ncbi:Lsr2 protein [Micrococcales bacterium KH10]|nr:Lsr2 protein [Micrococcales bacterium KH10]
MAQKVQVVLEDDIDGGPASSTVTFALDGTAYEIDLNEENAAKLRDSIAEWIRYARRVGRLNRGHISKRTPGGVAGNAGNGRNIGDVRAWLIENGYQVSSRGRIAAELQEIYDAAHQ